MFTNPIAHFSGGASFDKWLRDSTPASQPSTLNFFGVNANEVVCCGEPAAGVITGKVAATVFTPATGAELYQQVFTGGAGDPLGAGFIDGAFTRFNDLAGGVAITNQAWAILVPHMLLAPLTAGRYILVNSYDYARGLRVIPYLAGGLVRIYCYGDLASVNCTTPTGLIVGVPGWVLLWRSITASLIGITPSWGAEATVAFAAANNMASGQPTSIGPGPAFAHNSVVSTIPFFFGAAAEYVISRRAIDPPAWWAAP